MILFRTNPILIAAAVIPAIALLVYVYRRDRLEPESPILLASLVLYGILTTAIAMVVERIGSFLLGLFVADTRVLYYAILFFVIVGPAEEGAKYVLLRRRTWDNPSFNCQFDGVVYAVFVSLGFALWENIGYVAMYGFGTALLRAVTAVPGHACFGVFMGAWYGLAKRLDAAGKRRRAKTCRILALGMPAVIHGTYDFIASIEITGYGWIFAAFIAVLFAVSWWTVRGLSKRDRYIRRW